jgi:hypothetical protein
MEKRRVLATGACGYIAAQLLPALRERHELTLVDARTTDRVGNSVEGVHVTDRQARRGSGFSSASWRPYSSCGSNPVRQAKTNS